MLIHVGQKLKNKLICEDIFGSASLRNFICFPQAVLCSHCIAAKAHTLAGLSLRPYVTASCMLVILCIVGKHKDNDNNNNKGVRIILCSEKVKDTPQMLALTHKDTEGYKNRERMNKREQL